MAGADRRGCGGGGGGAGGKRARRQPYAPASHPKAQVASRLAGPRSFTTAGAVPRASSRSRSPRSASFTWWLLAWRRAVHTHARRSRKPLTAAARSPGFRRADGHRSVRFADASDGYAYGGSFGALTTTARPGRSSAWGRPSTSWQSPMTTSTRWSQHDRPSLMRSAVALTLGPTLGASVAAICPVCGCRADVIIQ